MESGYLSREAVKDLLAVREGEAIYLRNRVEALEMENEILRKKLDHLQSKLDVQDTCIVKFTLSLLTGVSHAILYLLNEERVISLSMTHVSELIED